MFDSLLKYDLGEEVAEKFKECGIDTYTTEAYFSARREGFKCGRIINAIMLKLY